MENDAGTRDLDTAGAALMRALLEAGGRVREGDEWHELVLKFYNRTQDVGGYFQDTPGGFTKQDGYVTFSETAWDEIGRVFEKYLLRGARPSDR
jgi:hypothetical protein